MQAEQIEEEDLNAFRAAVKHWQTPIVVRLHGQAFRALGRGEYSAKLSWRIALNKMQWRSKLSLHPRDIAMSPAVRAGGLVKQPDGHGLVGIGYKER